MKNKLRAVLVTTEYRGVFFGYANKTDGDTIKLKDARCCIYWSSDVKGFLGLAKNGPSDKCRVGPPVDIELRKVTSVSKVSDEAAEKWELAPWG